MAGNSKICKPAVLSEDEKKKRRDVELKKADTIINNTISSEDQAEQIVKEGRSISTEDISASQGVSKVQEVSRTQPIQPPKKLGKEEGDPKQFTPSLEVERKLAPQLEEGQTLQDAPKVVQDEVKSQKKTTKTTFKLPKGLVEEVANNPVLNNDLLEDLEELTTQERIIKPCDPETMAEQIKEFKELRDSCFPTVPTSDEKKAQRDKISSQMDEFIEDITPDSELIDEADAQACTSKIEDAIKTIKIHNDFVKGELENIGEKVIIFFSLMASFDYQFHALLLYAKRYGETSYMTLINDTLNTLESRISNIKSPNSLIANTYKNFLLQQVTFWRSQVQNLDSTEISVGVNNAVSKEELARDEYDDIPPLLEDEFSRRTHSDNIHDIQFYTDLRNGRGKLTDLLVVMSREATQQEKENDTYFDHLMQETKVELESSMFPLIINNIRLRNIITAQLIHPILEYRGTQNNLKSRFIIIRNSWIPFIEDVINTYEISDKQSQIEKSVEILHQVRCINNKPIIGLEVSKNEKNEANIDLDWKTFPEDTETDIKKLAYWKKFQEILNKVALIPKHYSIGLLLPSATGIVRVPLPVIWTPIAVIPTQVSVIVIWLTVNGVIVSPTIWIWKFKPLGNNESVHQALFRGANRTIKSNTRTKSQDLGVANGLDIDPALTKNSTFTEDDIAVDHRMSLSNLPFVDYLNKWCSAAKPYMGFP